MTLTPDSQAPAEGFCLRLSEDQRHMLEPVRRFVRDHLEPLLGDASSDRLRAEARQAGQSLGLASAVIAERDGGLSLPALDFCLLLEELAAGPLLLAAELTASLPTLAASRHHAWLASLLPQDVESVLGEALGMPLVVAAPDAEATFALVPRVAAGLLALTPCSPSQWRLRWLDGEPVQDLLAGIRPAPGVHEGLHLLRIPRQDELRGTGFSTTIPAEEALRIMAWQGLWLAALLAGAARAATAFAYSYAQARMAFQHPLIHHQAVALKLADMAIATDGLRLQVWDLATRLSAAEALPEGRFASVAKHVVHASMEVHRHAVQVCGGHGYVEGFPPARRFQDARLLSLVLLELAQTLTDAESMIAPSALPPSVPLVEDAA